MSTSNLDNITTSHLENDSKQLRQHYKKNVDNKHLWQQTTLTTNNIDNRHIWQYDNKQLRQQETWTKTSKRTWQQTTKTTGQQVS